MSGRQCTTRMVQRYRQSTIPGLAADNPAADDLRAARSGAGPAIDRALAEFDFRRAAEAVMRIGHEGNRYVEAVRPWELAKTERQDHTDSGALDAALAELVATCRDLAVHLLPFLPTPAGRIAEQCGNGGTTVADPSPDGGQLRLTVTGNHDPITVPLAQITNLTVVPTCE